MKTGLYSPHAELVFEGCLRNRKLQKNALLHGFLRNEDRFVVEGDEIYGKRKEK